MPSPEIPSAAGPEHVLRRRGVILNAVARATELVLSSASWRAAVPGVLEVLGKATGVSRAYLFECTRQRSGRHLVSQRFEWSAPGVEPQIDNHDLQDLDLVESGYGRWSELLSQNKPVVGDIGDFPESEKPLLEAQAIKSLVVQPVFDGPVWWGFMGFDACEREQSWDDVEVDALRIAALVLGATIHGEQRDEQLRQSHKMEALGRMAGGVAHDFNNVLAVMVGSLDLVERALVDGRPTDEALRRLSVVQQATRQASRLTRQLLDFSRRRREPARTCEPLATIEAIAELLRQAVGKGVNLDIDALGQIEPVQVEPEQLEQVVLNLAVNARDAMPRGGALQLRLRTLEADDAQAFGDTLPPGRYTLISVRDSGEGIPIALRDRVFEPFFSTKAEGHGTGLGLATVYSTVTSTGGQVRLTSEVGQGTEMRVYLPVVHANEQASPQSDRPPRRSSGVRLLGEKELVVVCDDNDAMRGWVESVLLESGYRVIATSSAAECLAHPAVAAGAIELLVSDVQMPNGDGPSLRKRLCELRPGLPTVLMSGFAADLLERGGIDARCEIFLDKPFTREQLLDAVHLALMGGLRIATKG